MKVAVRDVMMGADFSAAQAAKEALGLVRAGTNLGIRFFVVDALYREVSRQPIPMRSLVSVNGGAALYIMGNHSHAFGFGLANVSEGAALALAHGDDDLALAVLIDDLTAVFALFPLICGLHVAAKLRAIDLNIAFECAGLASKLYSLADLVKQHKGGLVVDCKITGQLKRAVAFCAVYEHGDGGQNVAHLDLAGVKDGAACDAELLAAAFALSSRAGFEVVVIDAAAFGANRFAVRVLPAQSLKRFPSLGVGHAHDLHERERFGFRREKEVLGYIISHDVLHCI